jgi:uncharacterized protein involved in type VI secretion and phage assembly
VSKIEGVVIGLVTQVDDPDKQGRVKLNFPWLDDKHETDWIRIATMMGGDNRGSFFMPEVGDEVLVAFEHGDTRFPIVIGFFWNGKDKPPSQHVRDRKIMSKNGHMIRFLDATPDSGSKGALIVEDAHGNRISLSNGKIKIQSVAVLEIDAPLITLQGPGYKRVIAPNSNPI